jgi:hypothetical protein
MRVSLTFSRGIQSFQSGDIFSAKICKDLLHTLRLPGLQFSARHTRMVLPRLQPFIVWLQGEIMMKLPLISASVVAYTLLATAWICQTDLLAFY